MTVFTTLGRGHINVDMYGDVRPTDAEAFRKRLNETAAAMYRDHCRREELCARLLVGAEWIDWIEASVPEEMP